MCPFPPSYVTVSSPFSSFLLNSISRKRCDLGALSHTLPKNSWSVQLYAYHSAYHSYLLFIPNTKLIIPTKWMISLIQKTKEQESRIIGLSIWVLYQWWPNCFMRGSRFMGNKQSKNLHRNERQERVCSIVLSVESLLTLSHFSSEQVVKDQDICRIIDEWISGFTLEVGGNHLCPFNVILCGLWSNCTEGLLILWWFRGTEIGSSLLAAWSHFGESVL